MKDAIRKLATMNTATPPVYGDYPHKSAWGAISEGDLRTALRDIEKPMLYIHMPYCMTQCYFCTCFVLLSRNYKDIHSYLQILYKEIELHRQLMEKTGPYDFREIHLGGGTPTYVSHEDFDIMCGKLQLLIPDFGTLDEFSIEIDPRRVKKDKMKFYHERGINRISFGVQDFDPKVMKSVNRLQPAVLTEKLLTPEIRDLFSHGVNFDVICGLPHQTMESMRKTIKWVADMSPDRVCLSFLILNPYKPHQSLMPKEAIPGHVERKIMFWEATEILLGNGYVRTGADQFAKRGDVIAQSAKNKTLFQNQMGITPGRCVDVLGLGISAASTIGNFYFQNTLNYLMYENVINAGHIPLFRGYKLTLDDVLRRYIIKQLRNYFSLDFEEVEWRFRINFREYFQAELKEVSKLTFVVLTETGITMTDAGEHFSDLVSRVFDSYTQAYSNFNPAVLAPKTGELETSNMIV